MASKQNNKEFEARKKVLADMVGELDETKRMQRNKSLIWKVRGVASRIEYWLIAYSFWVALLLWFLTGDFWKGMAFYAVSQLYALSANFRGASLHVENLVEWIIKKTI